MPEALLTGDEPVSVRAHDATMLQRGAVKGFEGVARGILEDDELVHTPVLHLLGGSLFVRDTGIVERGPDLLQLGSIGSFPTGYQQAVLLPRHDYQARRKIVHAQVQRSGHGALALDHAEDFQSVLTPGIHIGCLDAHVGE